MEESTLILMFDHFCFFLFLKGFPKFSPNPYTIKTFLVASPLILGYDATASSNKINLFQIQYCIN